MPVQKNDCASLLIFWLFWLWICFTIVLRFGIEITASLIAPDTAGSALVYLPFIQGIAILGPALLLALFWKNPAYRPIFRLWAWSGAYILWLIPVHFVNSVTIQAQAFGNLLLTLVFLVVFLIVERKRATLGTIARGTDYRLPLALLITATLALPWLAWGALGSPLDTILQFVSGLAFGVLASRLGESYLQSTLYLASGNSMVNTLWVGLTIATTLAILVSGLGLMYGVMHTILILLLIPLAWAWVGLRKIDDREEPSRLRLANLAFPAALIGLAVALPTMLVDSNELALVASMSPGELLQWTVRSTRLSALIGLVWAITLNTARYRHALPAITTQLREEAPATRQKTWYRVISALVILVWLSGLGIYIRLGQPGFFGDRMFVILEEHADLSGATGIADYTQRREFVYRSLAAQADTSQADLRHTLDRFQIPYQPYYLVNAIELVNNPVLRVWLNSRPEVDRIVDSPRLRPLAQIPPQTVGTGEKPAQPPWNLTQIGVPRVWDEFDIRGQGVIVGQSDSGVQWNHPDLLETYRGKAGNHAYHWLDPWNASPEPLDQNGHGTHTLGTVLGKNTGVAPAATWIACVNLSRNLGNPAFYLDCLQFMLAPYPQGGDPLQDGKPADGAMVLNNSWGCPELEGCDPYTLLEAAAALRQAGVFVVASAGNEGPTCSSVTDPLAIYSQVFSVGALDQAGELAGFSSLGPVTVDGSGRTKPDLVAPGVDILSTFPGGTYAIENGTSMAGPHIVGVVALIWSANPDLIGDIDRTEQILRQTARPYIGALPDCPGSEMTPSNAVGYGVVDAYAAVKMALSLR